MIELQRGISGPIGRVLAGAPLAAIGALFLVKGFLSVVACVFFLAIGLPLVVNGVRLLVLRPPRLRATIEGVWFGGGRIVPWDEISAIYAGSLDVQFSHVRTKTQSIAFEFHRRKTMLRLPIACLLAAPMSVGDVDVSPSDSNEKAVVLVAKLEAMRTNVRGDEAGVTHGASEIPTAVEVR